jgi:RNA-binding protein
VPTKTTTKTGEPRRAVAPKPLTGKERRKLRALGHSLSPVVQIGKAGLTRGVSEELQNALDAHELIKVQLLGECPIERTEAAERVAATTKAAVVQTLGRMLLFYRPNPDKRRILVEPPKAGAVAQDSPKRAVKRRRTSTSARRPSAGHATRRQRPSRENKK